MLSVILFLPPEGPLRFHTGLGGPRSTQDRVGVPGAEWVVREASVRSPWRLFHLGNSAMLTATGPWPCPSSVPHFISSWPARTAIRCPRASPQLCSRSTCKPVRPRPKSWTLDVFPSGLTRNFCFLHGVQIIWGALGIYSYCPLTVFRLVRLRTWGIGMIWGWVICYFHSTGKYSLEGSEPKSLALSWKLWRR